MGACAAFVQKVAAFFDIISRCVFQSCENIFIRAEKNKS
jgi:hypothetical protein